MKVKIKIIPSEKKMGMEMEKEEHMDITKGDPKIIEKIVMAHLKENPNYYSMLEKMEEESEEDKDEGEKD